jgi:hypothetical protein
VAEVLADAPPAAEVGSYLEKYREGIARIGFNSGGFARAYSVLGGSDLGDPARGQPGEAGGRAPIVSGGPTMKATPALEPLVRQGTILLTTYRRDGTPVGTPVHVAVEGNRAFVRT